MVEAFKNRAELEAWLETQPPAVISVFAARAALRLLPVFYSQLPSKDPNSNLTWLILISLWSMATALAAGKWQLKSDDPYIKALRAYASSNVGVGVAFTRAARKAALDSLKVTDASADTAAGKALHKSAQDASNKANSLFAVVYAAANALYCSGTVSNGLNPKLAANAAYMDPKFPEFNIGCSWDRDFIERGISAESLADKKLWLGSKNSLNLPTSVDISWRNLKPYLLSLNHDWHVWTDWYEDRLHGNEDSPFALPFIEEIEIGDPKNGKHGRITFPTEDYRDPAKVNAQIKQLIEDYRERQGLLEQDTTAETFGLNADGQITRTTSETSSELADTVEQRDWYNSLRQAALGMKDIGENALGKAARPVNIVLDALPKDINNAKVAQLWPAANRIRKLKAAHERAIESGDDYHPNRLAEEVVDDIGQFVDVYNNLVIGDSGLSDKDKAAKGPQDPEADVKAREAAAQGIEAAIEHGLFDEEAQLIIEDDITEDREIIAKIEAETSLTVLESLAQANIQIEKENAIRAIILRVRESEKFSKIEDGALLAIGASVVTYIGFAMPALLGLVRSIFGL